jgi:8-amino-7-oxononanoate synthase
MNHVEQYLASKLNEREVAGNLRQLSTNRAPVDFFSNDYLGLATTGALRITQPSGKDGPGTGSTGSRLLSGNSIQAEELEHTIAAFHGAEAALLFNSGYDANIGLLSSIAGRDSTILSDELCHASLIDGIRLSTSSRKYKFRHNDLTDLADKLATHSGKGQTIVVVESVYSMDGDMAPLADLVQLCETYNAQLIVDEAHATGVVGDKGAGAVCAAGLQQRVFARVHTFGKALGCHGAAVVGSGLLKRYLINFARPFIYTTALPEHAVQAVRSAYRYLSADSFTNEPLHQLITYFGHRKADQQDKGWKVSHTPIQALVVGENERCKQLATQLQRAGLQVNPILYPTVPLGMERLRICLHIFNTSDQLDLLFENLEKR